MPGNRELIVRKGLFVREEVELPIILHLMAVPGARLEEIETVVSHPIALAQCHKVLERLGAQAGGGDQHRGRRAPARRQRRPQEGRGRLRSGGGRERFDDPVPQRP